MVESLKPGSAFYVDCYAVAGIPSPGIEWMKNEKTITPGMYFKYLPTFEDSSSINIIEDNKQKLEDISFDF